MMTDTSDNDRTIRKVVIVGGGSAGWMTAAALSQSIQTACDITLIESEEIGTVGVGEATIPPIRTFNQVLGIDEHEFVRRTKGTFKLGIQFVNWGRQGNRYFHPFGGFGRPFDLVQTQHFWLAAYQAGTASSFDDYCMAWAAARFGRFDRPSPDPRHVLSTFDYAYHFDASLYAAYLRAYAEARRVVREQGKIVDVNLDPLTGHVTSVRLETGKLISGELFIDCSGVRALLIEGALKTGYEDWSHWLPCDRALAVPTERGEMAPYTRSTAHAAGWQWRIPLQHRTGNGHVFSSAFMDPEAAEQVLLAHVENKPLAEPRLIRFATGRRKLIWNKNVIAIGLSSGFLEPLESTSLHLIQTGISKLLAYFPDRDFDLLVTNEFNRVAIHEYERIRDFIILHYKLTERDDSEMWRYCAQMSVPEPLQMKIEHFRRYGRVLPSEMDIFGPPSWLAVHIGQFNLPERSDPMLAYRTTDGAAYLAKLKAAMEGAARVMPTQEAYIDRFCRAD